MFAFFVCSGKVCGGRTSLPEWQARFPREGGELTLATPKVISPLPFNPLGVGRAIPSAVFVENNLI